MEEYIEELEAGIERTSSDKGFDRLKELELMKATLLKGLRKNVKIFEDLLEGKVIFYEKTTDEEILEFMEEKLVPNIKQELDLLYKTQKRIKD